MTPEERMRLRALADAATPGAWVVVGDSIGAEVKGCTCGQGGLYPHEQYCGLEGPVITGAAAADAEFIAAAREAIPTLLDAAAAAEAKLAVVDKFLAERAGFITAIKNCPPSDDTDTTDTDYWRWQGNAEARRVLTEDLAKARGDV